VGHFPVQQIPEIGLRHVALPCPWATREESNRSEDASRDVLGEIGGEGHRVVVLVWDVDVAEASLRLLKQVLTVDEYHYPGRWGSLPDKGITSTMAGHKLLNILQIQNPRVPATDAFDRVGREPVGTNSSLI
jgi:hypothetical protein